MTHRLSKHGWNFIVAFKKVRRGHQAVATGTTTTWHYSTSCKDVPIFIYLCERRNPRTENSGLRFDCVIYVSDIRPPFYHVYGEVEIYIMHLSMVSHSTTTTRGHRFGLAFMDWSGLQTTCVLCYAIAEKKRNAWGGEKQTGRNKRGENGGADFII